MSNDESTFYEHRLGGTYVGEIMETKYEMFTLFIQKDEQD
jgi:hypothetical protein